MTFHVDLISLNADFQAVPVRTVTVEAADSFAAVLAATDLITEAEGDRVFAALPSDLAASGFAVGR